MVELYFCQCLSTEISAWGNRDYTTETPSVRVARSRLSFFYFLPISYFSGSIYFPFLFLAPRIRISDDLDHMTRKILEE